MMNTTKMIMIPYDRYIRLQEYAKSPNSLETSTLSESVPETKAPVSDTGNKDSMKIEFILQQLPEGLKNKAKMLLTFIEKSTNIRWKENGEVIINTDCIPYSQITDLVRDAVSHHKSFDPVGYMQFYNALQTVPLSLIKNKRRRDLIQTGRGTSVDASVPPPPGQSDNKAIDLGIEYKTSNSKTRATSPSLLDWKTQWQSY